MARTARVVAEGYPHHIVQRGNRRQQVFFSDHDRLEYLRLLKDQSEVYGLKIWAYCLMDNHVHLIVVPEQRESLAKAIGEAHKRYTRMIHFREGWRGYLWQGRFGSFVLDDEYVYAAVRYVERNPVRAKLVEKAGDYKWSSAGAHIDGENGDVLTRFYLQGEIKDWVGYLAGDEDKEDLKLMRRHGATGRPLGGKEFMEQLAKKLGVDLAPRKQGRPRN